MRSTKRGKIKTVPNNTQHTECSVSQAYCIYVYVIHWKEKKNTSVVSNVKEGIKHSIATLKKKYIKKNFFFVLFLARFSHEKFSTALKKKNKYKTKFEEEILTTLTQHWRQKRKVKFFFSLFICGHLANLLHKNTREKKMLFWLLPCMYFCYNKWYSRSSYFDGYSSFTYDKYINNTKGHS